MITDVIPFGDKLPPGRFGINSLCHSEMRCRRRRDGKFAGPTGVTGPEYGVLRTRISWLSVVLGTRDRITGQKGRSFNSYPDGSTQKVEHRHSVQEEV
jgi:hypothetical protein